MTFGATPDAGADEARTRQLGSVALQLCTVNEACELLRVSRWQIYRLLDTRELASVKIGRRRLIPMTEIRDFIERLQRRGVLQ